MIFLPKFPNSKFLNDKPLHRLIIVIAYTVELYIGFYIGIWSYIKEFIRNDEFTPWKFDPNYFNFNGFWTQVLPYILLIAGILVLIGMFSVNLIYRLILYIVLGNKWKDKPYNQK